MQSSVHLLGVQPSADHHHHHHHHAMMMVVAGPQPQQASAPPAPRKRLPMWSGRLTTTTTMAAPPPFASTPAGAACSTMVFQQRGAVTVPRPAPVSKGEDVSGPALSAAAAPTEGIAVSPFAYSPPSLLIQGESSSISAAARQQTTVRRLEASKVSSSSLASFDMIEHADYRTPRGGASSVRGSLDLTSTSGGGGPKARAGGAKSPSAISSSSATAVLVASPHMAAAPSMSADMCSHATTDEDCGSAAATPFSDVSPLFPGSGSGEERRIDESKGRRFTAAAARQETAADGGLSISHQHDARLGAVRPLATTQQVHMAKVLLPQDSAAHVGFAVTQQSGESMPDQHAIRGPVAAAMQHIRNAVVHVLSGGSGAADDLEVGSEGITRGSGWTPTTGFEVPAVHSPSGAEDAWQRPSRQRPSRQRLHSADDLW